jgi:hypothetical protein
MILTSGPVDLSVRIRPLLGRPDDARLRQPGADHLVRRIEFDRRFSYELIALQLQTRVSRTSVHRHRSASRGDWILRRHFDSAMDAVRVSRGTATTALWSHRCGWNDLIEPTTTFAEDRDVLDLHADWPRHWSAT